MTVVRVWYTHCFHLPWLCHKFSIKLCQSNSFLPHYLEQIIGKSSCNSWQEKYINKHVFVYFLAFKYLRILVIWNWSYMEEIRGSIYLHKSCMYKTAFEKVKGLLTTRRIQIHLRKRFAGCYIWNVVLYDCEAWTIKKKQENTLRNILLVVSKPLNFIWKCK